MNCFITHTPFTSTWLIPERNAEWAREVYGVEKEPALIKEVPSWDSMQCEIIVKDPAKPVPLWENGWRDAG